MAHSKAWKYYPVKTTDKSGASVSHFTPVDNVWKTRTGSVDLDTEANVHGTELF